MSRRYKVQIRGMEMIKRKLFTSLLFLFVFLLTACGGGGGGGGGPVTLSGFFVDSAVGGLRYVTSSGINGVTDPAGGFNYASGDNVTFFLGDIQIGEPVLAAGLLTPVSLVPGATDETNTTVSNIARFLQSLDVDGNPDNGITIEADIATEAAGQSLDFTSGSFDTDATTLVEYLRDQVYGAGDTGTLVDASTAEAHLVGSLLCERAGTFEGTWVQTVGVSDSYGTWTFVVYGDGTLAGYAQNSLDLGTTGLSGSVSSDGTSVAGNSTDGTTFSGSVNLDGTISGNWENTFYSVSGTYTGSRLPNTSSDCSSGPGESVGTLTVSGTDTSTIGTEFTPNTISVDDPYTFRWRTVDPVDGITHAILVQLDPANSNLVSMTYSRVIGADEYHYQLTCGVGDCSTIPYNPITYTATFTNTEFLAVGGLATAPITLNGTLSLAEIINQLNI